MSNSPPRYPLNPKVQALSCLRCGAAYELDDDLVDRGIGCPTCLEQGYPASLRLDYDEAGAWQVLRTATGMKRYVDRLPYLDYPSLGEGGTPLVELMAQARAMGMDRLWVKVEGQNPTGSHKDRMSALVVARAVSLGRDTVVAASSGNAGASLAAYAGAAGLGCAIISTPQIHPGWARAIELAGARLILAGTPMERWQLLREMVEEEGGYPVTNYLNPPVGSCPFGLQGYKTVGHEIAEQCQGTGPTLVLVPTARGDLLWGIWQGLLEAEQSGLLPRVPRLAAVEPLTRLSRVLAGEDYRREFPAEPHAMSSIGGGTATYQSLAALRESEGCAVKVGTGEARAAQRDLARWGFYAELSSAASLAGLRALQEQGQVGPSERVVLILTSHGYKDAQAGHREERAPFASDVAVSLDSE